MSTNRPYVVTRSKARLNANLVEESTDSMAHHMAQLAVVEV